MSGAMTGLTLDRLEITLGPRRLMRLNLTVPPGQVLTVTGPSGAGKSTLLAALIGALPPAFRLSGRVLLDGRDITALPTAARRIGLIFQDDLLFPHLSVGQNLAFALPPGGSRAERRARIGAALSAAELPGFADRDPATLSGGQRARVALQRALLARPRALLLDEPFARLDTALRARIRETTFAALHALPAILVTHDPEDARAAAGPVIRLGEEDAGGS